MSPVHQVRPKPSCKAQWKKEEVSSWILKSCQPHRDISGRENGKKTRKTEKEVGKHQGMDRPGVRQWENIKEWTGLEFAKSRSAVKNGGKWRKLVVKSSVVPQRPSWLRDQRRWRVRARMHALDRGNQVTYIERKTLSHPGNFDFNEFTVR